MGIRGQVLETAEKTPGMVCTGFHSEQALRELYAHADLFVLPSSHEGLPIVASDIPANLEVGLPAEHYYPLGDVDALAARLSEFAVRPLTAESRASRRAWVSERFDWRDIARRTDQIYQEVMAGR